MNSYSICAFRIHKRNISTLLKQCNLPDDKFVNLPKSSEELERIAMREYDIRTFCMSDNRYISSMWIEREHNYSKCNLDNST